MTSWSSVSRDAPPALDSPLTTNLPLCVVVQRSATITRADRFVRMDQEGKGVPAPAVVTELLAAVRGLRRAPLVSGSAIICIALGIGATSAISSAISRALLQPLPFRSPERLVTV